MRDDFRELNLYFEDREEGETVTLFVRTRDGEQVQFDGVTHNPVRYKGEWTISHHFQGQRATSIFPADEVWFFTLIESASRPTP